MDEQNASSAVPATPGQASNSPPPANELFPEKESPAQSSTLEKIGSSVSGLFERHGITFKRGRGRPRKDGSPAASDVPVGVPATALPAVAAGAPAATNGAGDKALIKKCASAVVKSVVGFFDKILYTKACDATGDKDFATKLVIETTLTAPEKEAFEEIAVVLGEMAKLDPLYAVVGASIAIVAASGGRYAMAFVQLNREIAKKEQKGAAPANAKL